MRMKNCIACKNEATTWTGHLHTEIGTITVGYCKDHPYYTVRSKRPRSIRCTSINENSCSGDYKLNEIELAEELTPDVLLEHARSEEFSRIVDLEMRGSVVYPSKPKEKKSFIERLFNL